MRFFYVLLIFLIAGVSASCAQSGSARVAATITTPSAHQWTFYLEVADTAQSRERGLMGRTHLAPDAGMLFHFDEDAPRTMWMKNTLIPLDMLFISANGEILAIHEQARPGDLTHIDSPGPIRDVLEIAGGRARALGIGVGSRISVPNLIPAQAIN